MNVGQLIVQLQSLDPLALVVCSSGMGDQFVAPVEFADYVELQDFADGAEHYRIERGAALTAVLIGNQLAPAKQAERKAQ